eukprot:TRINITY_DN9281_c1_g3_i2.p1 TRINITY_DN9281_c1_g3~~TRINITY_DN9281_c1_g3_i2.p1  ORF type:complete len:480 (+),score=57.76 TRINITY_DN9281_c1_g3_i2:66-1505(+)
MLASLGRCLPMESWDTSFVLLQKKVMLSAGIAAVVLFSLQLMRNPTSALVVSGSGIGVGAGVLSVMQVILERELRGWAVESAMYGYAAALILLDYEQAVFGRSILWPGYFALIDVCLVVDMGDRITRNLVALLLLWLVVLAVEGWFRLGVFDLSFLPSQEERRQEARCTALPCTRDPFSSAILLVTQVAFLVLTFFCTKHRVSRENYQASDALGAAAHVAFSFSAYDLDAARDVMEAPDCALPAPLLESFHRLLSGLQSYRPFLPDFISRQEILTVPSLPRNCLRTILFTDIVHSGRLWEGDAEAMRDGLRLHNRLVRECYSLFNGYEVKTIGDAFMLAFERATEGVGFGLHLLEMLTETTWEERFVDVVNSSGEDGLDGMPLRIGMHCGMVQVEMNQLVGRNDFFGPTVNKAARVESVCACGAVAVTNEVMQTVGHLPDAIVASRNSLRLRGFDSEVVVTQLLPLSLERRVRRIAQGH